MIDRRRLLASAAALAGATALPALGQISPDTSGLPETSSLKVARFIDADHVELQNGSDKQTTARGATFGPWTLVEITDNFVVLEDFTTPDGNLLLVTTDGVMTTFGKSREDTTLDYAKGFLGHTEAEVRASPTDLLGGLILAKPGDPDYAEVAAVFPPIRKVWGDTYNFLSTPESQDKVWFAYGGRSPNFNPAVYQPSIEDIRKDGKVQDGLVGGYLPCLRFVYPESDGVWTELLAFAPFRMINDNPRMQPVWYRISRIEGGKLAWTKHVDSYLPYPPRTGDDARDFYNDLIKFKDEWDARLAPGLQLDLPDTRMMNQARHSLIRAMMGRSAGYPKYGTVDKNYGGSEHDGFPDTFTVETAAMIEWGLIDRAGAYIDNYFGQFVRDDGVILYRGPETGQFGRMLTVAAQYVTAGGDPGLLVKHRSRIDAITDVLLSMRAKALLLPKDDPAYGMLSGWSEADAVLEADPQRYMQPYFSNSTEAARGFRDLGRVWVSTGATTNDPDLTAWGRQLIAESESLNQDVQTAITRSILHVDGQTIIPTIAGVKEPFHVVLQRDKSDPQWRSYRSYMEMLYSGNLTKDQVDLIVDYRTNNHDIVLGMPMAYGYNTGEMAGFLSYGHGYGLIRNDRIREALLMTWSDMAHQYTRGMWLAPETRRPLSDDWASAYCSPAQLVAPLMTRWLLVFEDPESDTLWLGKGMPRAWLRDGESVKVANATTHWGQVAFSTRAGKKVIQATVTLPAAMTAEIRLRLRAESKLKAVTVNGKRWQAFDPVGEFISLPAGISGQVEIVAHYA